MSAKRTAAENVEMFMDKKTGLDKTLKALTCCYGRGEDTSTEECRKTCPLGEYADENCIQMMHLFVLEWLLRLMDGNRKDLPTNYLVNELKYRQSIQFVRVEANKRKKFTVTGPMNVLLVED